MRFQHFALAFGLCLLSAQAGVLPPQHYDFKTVPWGGGGYVDGLVYHPKAKNLLYARTDVGGAFRYDYAAKSWVPLNDGFGRSDGDMNGILSIAVDPNDANKLFMACGLYTSQWAGKGAVLRSDDQGKTWKRTDLSVKLGGNEDGRGTGERLQVDPNAGNILFLGSSRDGLWKSTDGAASFGKVGGFPAREVSLVVIDASSGSKGAPSQIIYVGAADGGLYVSRDGGVSFAIVPGAPSQTPQHAVISSDGYFYVTFAASDGKNTGRLNPSNIVLGSVWKMELKTGKWTDISPVRPVLGQRTFGYSGIDIDPSHPGTIVTSTIDRWWPETDDIFLSRDGGASWTSLKSQSRHDRSRFPWLNTDVQVVDGDKDKMGSWTSDVKINPFNPDELIYGTGGGVWMTSELGLAGSGNKITFAFADDNLEETAILQMVAPPRGPKVVAVMGDVGGGIWDDLTKTPGAGKTFKTENNHSVDIAWLRPAFMARTPANPPYGTYTEDGGANWLPFPSIPPSLAQGANGGWRESGKLAVSAAGTSIVWSIPRDKAYYSADKGTTWTAVLGWPKNDDGSLVPIADRTINGVFYVHDRAGGNVLISIDAGKSFQPIITGVPNLAYWQSSELAVVPGHLRDLWLALPTGLFHSASAESPLANIRGVDEAWHLGFGKPAPGQTYPAVFLSGKVKGKAGIWRSDDEGANWVLINDEAHRFGDGGSLAGDPNEYGTVYIVRLAGGIVVGRPGK